MIDLLIIFATIVSIFRGYSIGFVRQFLSTIGFFGGLLIGAKLEKYTILMAHSSNARSLIGLVTTLGMALVLVTIMEYVGINIKNKLIKIKINLLDSGLGSVISVITLILGIWLISSLINNLRVPGIQTYINQSKIITYLNKKLPPAPTILSDLGKIIDPNGFPQVFINGEPNITQVTKLPQLGQFQNVINKEENSVVKIVGQGCGGIVEGSGFVAYTNLIITNAHVVAGIAHPYITTLSGRNYDAKIVFFDPNLDLAILRVDGLSPNNQAIPISNQIYSSGQAAFIMGYPGGGNLTAVPASVINQIEATGQNIYGNNTISRSIYELNANVIPGNSGSPLINASGQVIGLIFAQSTNYNHVGYALTTPKIVSDLNNVKSSTNTVSTGNCAE